MAKLFPHFATCMGPPGYTIIYRYIIVAAAIRVKSCGAVLAVRPIPRPPGASRLFNQIPVGAAAEALDQKIDEHPDLD
jgi:hypothetical protein